MAVVVPLPARQSAFRQGSPTADELAAEARAAGVHVLELPSLGEREPLDEGKLHVYSPSAEPPERVGERFVVDAAEHRLEAAIDGEPDVLQTPVEFRVGPGALRVLVPPAESG